jgi:hypothetical protein
MPDGWDVSLLIPFPQFPTHHGAPFGVDVIYCAIDRVVSHFRQHEHCFDVAFKD